MATIVSKKKTTAGAGEFSEHVPEYANEGDGNAPVADSHARIGYGQRIQWNACI